MYLRIWGDEIVALGLLRRILGTPLGIGAH